VDSVLFMLKSELWRHKCKFGKLTKGTVAQQAQLLLPVPAGMSAAFNGLLSNTKDDVKFMAKSDSLIAEYAKKLIQRERRRSPTFETKFGK
jgi:hypothetical protein